jgi:hypothetical protein
MVSDIAQNFVVTGLTPSDGGGINLTIAAGYARCEGWRIVSDGETHALTAVDDTYYVYLELTLTGDKVTNVTVQHYTAEQSLTNRIYIAEVTVTTGGTDIGTVTDRRNLFAIDPSLVQISGTTGLDDWRHASDLTKLDGADIYDGSIVDAKIAAGSNLTFDNVAETITSAWTYTNYINAQTSQTYGIRVAFTTTYTGRMYSPSTSAVRYASIGARDVSLYSDGGDAYVTSTTGNVYINPNGTLFLQGDTILDDGVDLILEGSGGTERGRISASSTALFLNASGAARVDIQVSGTSYYRGDTASFSPSTCGTPSLGTSSLRWNSIWSEAAVSVSACADVAEWFAGEGGEPGDIYAIENSGLLVKSTKENDPQVIGAYSEKPALDMGNEAHLLPSNIKNDKKRYEAQLKEWKEFNVLIGLSGSIPVKVSGEVKAGDYLISSNHSSRARAVKRKDKFPLFVIGRAMENKEGRGFGKVKMIIEKQILYHNPVPEPTSTEVSESVDSPQ